MKCRILKNDAFIDAVYTMAKVVLCIEQVPCLIKMPSAEIAVEIVGILVLYLESSTLKNTEWYKELSEKYVLVGDACLIKVNTAEKTLIIPDAVKSISSVTDSEYARVSYCPNIKEIVFGRKVEKVLKYAFSNSLISTVLFNESLSEIQQGAFHSCDELRFVCLPNSVKNIGCNAFAYSRDLSCVVLPENLDSISHDAFAGCSNLKRIIVPCNKPTFAQKVAKSLYGADMFPYDKCVYLTTVENRHIKRESELVTKKCTQWALRSPRLSSHPLVKASLAKVLRDNGIYTIGDLRQYRTEKNARYGRV